MIEEGLEHNQDIQSLQDRVEAARELIPFAGSLEDPRLGLGEYGGGRKLLFALRECGESSRSELGGLDEGGGSIRLPRCHLRNE